MVFLTDFDNEFDFKITLRILNLKNHQVFILMKT